MRQSLAILLVLVLLLMSLTACAKTQKTAASGISQETRQYGGGNMPQGERPTGERTNANRTEGTQMRIRDSGASDFSANNHSAGAGGAQKVVAGKVKSIVGNEVVLIVTQNSDTMSQRKSRENTDMTAAASYQQRNETAQSAEQAAQSQAADQAASSESAAQELTATYLIPVGMAVGNKDFSSIKAGNTIRIYFGTDPSDGSEMITAVELR